MSGFEEEWDDGVLGDVLGDVLLGVVSSHLLLVDVLFKDITHYIGINFVIGTKRAFVQMPAKLVEKVKQFLEGSVGDIYIGVALFELVDLEETAVEIGNFSKQFLHLGIEFAFTGGLAQTVVEESQEEIAIERLEFILTPGLLHYRHTVTQVVGIAIEKALLLNEVHKHQPIEHKGGVPLEIGISFDALDELEKGSVFSLEALVELLGNFIYIEGGASAASDIHDRYILFFVDTNGNLVEALDERIAGLRNIEAVIAAGEGFAWLTANPLPDLLSRGLVGVDDEMLAGGLGNLMIDLQARGPIWDRGADKGYKTTLLGDSDQLEGPAVQSDIKLGLVIIPAQMFAKEGLEIE